MDFKKNSLNTFRLLAALQVMWGHTLAHLELSNVPVLGLFIGFFTGVPIFFTLSGFLIWHSIGRSDSFVNYAQKRFWRIYPELWIAVAVELVVLLLLYHHPIDWPKLGLFAIGQATIFQFWTPDFLRGYGCGCPNGALWTIAILIQFYFLDFFFYKWLKNRSLYVWGSVIVFSLVAGWLTPKICSLFPQTLGKLYTVTLIPYMWMFLIASLAAEYKDYVLPFLKKYWWIFIGLLILKRYVLHWDFKLYMYSLFDTLLLFAGILGFAYALPQVNIKMDISYGVYIYHMTVVNALIALGYKGNNWTLLVVIGVTCLLAWVSTITVGRHSVKKKKEMVE